MMRDDKVCGLIFRAKDAFNYYAFELKGGVGGFKRFRKVVKGVSEVIALKEDGGYHQNTWYQIKIEFKQGMLKAYL
jgi:hypothetical protein